jgi:hypothetical protein
MHVERRMKMVELEYAQVVSAQWKHDEYQAVQLEEIDDEPVDEAGVSNPIHIRDDVAVSLQRFPTFTNGFSSLPSQHDAAAHVETIKVAMSSIMLPPPPPPEWARDTPDKEIAQALLLRLKQSQSPAVPNFK